MRFSFSCARWRRLRCFVSPAASSIKAVRSPGLEWMIDSTRPWLITGLPLDDYVLLSSRWSATPPGSASAHPLGYDDTTGAPGPGQVKPDELRGATVSLTNPGGLGTVASVPRLMAGQGTIVATGSIAYPPGSAARTPRRSALGVEKVMTMTSTTTTGSSRAPRAGPSWARSTACSAGDGGFYEQVRQSLGLRAPADLPAAPAPAPAADGAGRRRRRPA